MLSALEVFLDYIGLSKQESTVFFTIYQYGPKPASTIAKIASIERTNTYKVIQKLIISGLIHETQIRGVKQFFVPSSDVLQQAIDKKKTEVERLASIHDQAITELKGLKQYALSAIPRITLYEGSEGIMNLFADLQQHLTTTWYRQIKFFASNTLDMQSHSLNSVHDIAADFFTFLSTKKISINAIVGEGTMLIEKLTQKYLSHMTQRLPAGYSAINCFVIGEVVSFVVYRDVPYAIKVHSSEIGQMINAFWKVVERE